jgi:transcriptional regulator with XRE-family HTH domain
MMHNDLDRLGEILKAARTSNNLTREQLAERINISPRYLMSIENENKKPSYSVLFRLIRELGIRADAIFYPEGKYTNNEIDQITRLLYQCDERDLKVLSATVKALLETK